MTINELGNNNNTTDDACSIGVSTVDRFPVNSYFSFQCLEMMSFFLRALSLSLIVLSSFDYSFFHMKVPLRAPCIAVRRSPCRYLVRKLLTDLFRCVDRTSSPIGFFENRLAGIHPLEVDRYPMVLIEPIFEWGRRSREPERGRTEGEDVLSTIDLH